MKTKIFPLGLIIAMCLAVAGVTAVYLISRQVDVSFRIVGSPGLALYFADHQTELMTLDWGAFDRGESKNFPTADYYFAENVGDITIYLSYSYDVSFPSGVIVTMYVNTNGVDWEAVAPNTIIPVGIDPGGHWLIWRMKVEVGLGSPFGEYPLTLSWNAYSSASG